MLSRVIKWTGSKLSRKLIIAYLLTVFVPVMLLGIITNIVYENHFRENINTTMSTAFQLLKSNIQSNLQEFQFASESLTIDQQVQTAMRSLNTTIKDQQFTMNSLVQINFLDKKLTEANLQIRIPILQSSFILENDMVITNQAGRYRNLAEQAKKDMQWMKEKKLYSTLIRVINDETNSDVLAHYTGVIDYQSGEWLGYVRFMIDANIMKQLLEEWMPLNTKVMMINSDGELLVDNSSHIHVPIDIIKEHNGKSDYFKSVDNNIMIMSQPMEDDTIRLVVAVSYIEMMQPLIQTRKIIMAAAFMILILSSVIFLIIARHINQPLKLMADRFKKIQMGNFNVRIPVQREDEIGQIGHGFNLMIDEIQYQIEQVLKTDIKTKEAELKILQNQMKPHFLYNTLESISMYAFTQGAPQISDMVTQLGIYYRQLIHLHKKEEAIPIQQELDFCNAYLDILQIRFGDKIKVHWSMDRQIEACLIPKLTLQPIIENAVQHGLEEKVGNGNIYITSKRTEMEAIEMITLSIEDNGLGMSSKQLERLREQIHSKYDTGASIGLRNVNERMSLFFGEHYRMVLSSEINMGTRVELHFPFRREGTL